MGGTPGFEPTLLALKIHVGYFYNLLILGGILDTGDSLGG